jgi:hypothetical protein
MSRRSAATITAAAVACVACCIPIVAGALAALTGAIGGLLGAPRCLATAVAVAGVTVLAMALLDRRRPNSATGPSTPVAPPTVRGRS